MISQTVGSYKIIAKLGEGGMGEVYLAEHKYIARRAAVKFLLPELTGSAEVVSRFFSEARAASLIEHPGICEVLDCEVHTDGRAYIVMEFLNGESLRGYLDRIGKLDGDERGGLAICRSMAGALAAAHAQGIVHRDLKPDNVFLHLPTGRAGEQPIVKLLDFGIAKLHGGPEGGSKTRTGQLLGTPLYMSPEQCRGARQVDNRSDIYSLGCIMFEMFCGRPPFMSEGFGDLIFLHISEPPPDPVGLAPGLSAPVRRLLLRCLEKAPDKRPASMEEVSALLAEAGAAEVVRLRTPVVRGKAGGEAPGARSPARWSSSPPPLATPTHRSGPHAFAPTATPASVAAGGLTPPPPSGARPPTIAPTTLGGGATEVLATGARRSGRRKLVLVALALAGAAAGVIVALQGRGAPVVPPISVTPVIAPALPVTEAKTARNEAAVPPATAPAPAVHASSAIKLTGVPDGATVLLDGRPAPSPLVVPRGPDTHRLTVEAEGFERWEQAVDASSDQTLAVGLKAKRAEAGTPAKSKRKNEHRKGPSQFNGFSDLY